MDTPTPIVAEPVIAEPVVTPMATPPVVAPVIDQTTLATILARMAAQDDEIATLRKTVSQNDLAAVEKAKKPMGLPVAYLKVLNGKVVVSSKSEKPQILYNPSNPEVAVGEILKARYFFLDGTDSGPIDQVEFTRTTDKLEGTILEGLKGIKDSDMKEVTLHFTKLITTDEDLAKSFVMPADLKINKNFLNP
jgi:hypothetical protein